MRNVRGHTSVKSNTMQNPVTSRACKHVARHIWQTEERTHWRTLVARDRRSWLMFCALICMWGDSSALQDTAEQKHLNIRSVDVLKHLRSGEFFLLTCSSKVFICFFCCVSLLIFSTSTLMCDSNNVLDP